MTRTPATHLLDRMNIWNDDGTVDQMVPICRYLFWPPARAMPFRLVDLPAIISDLKMLSSKLLILLKLTTARLTL